MERIAICDDDPQQIEIMTIKLEKYKAERSGLDVQVQSFQSGVDLLVAVNDGQFFDLLLIDIIMPELSGIELAKELRTRDADVPLVFLTTSKDYALDAFGLYATHYLIKPIREDVFYPVLDKIFASRRHEEEKFIVVSTADRKIKVLFSSIACVESIERRLIFHLTDGGTLNSKTIRVPFAEAVAPLFDDARFLHAHKSFILNMDMVEQLTSNSFVLRGGVEIIVPRYKYADAKNRYFEYLAKTT